MPALIDGVLSVLLLVGALLLFVSGIGLLRGANALARIQPVAKAGSVGAALLLLCIALAAGNFAIFMRALAASGLVLLNTALTSQCLAEIAGRALDAPPSGRSPAKE